MGIPGTVPFVGLTWDDVLFLLFAATMIGTALLVVTLRDIIRCGLALMASLGALAGLYVLLGAPLVAAAQVLIYIGGITVLILAILIAITVTATDWGAVAARLETATDTLALLLFRDFVLPFEIVSVLLLAAVIGGVFLAKREEGGPP